MNRLILLLESDFVRTLQNFLQRITQGEGGLLGVVLELLLIGGLVYAALKFLQGTRGARLLKSFGLILVTSFLVVRLVAETLHLERLIYLYPYFVGGVVLTTLVAFQPEVRRGLICLGDTRWLRPWAKENERIVDPIIRAVSSLSQKKIGALIAIQRQVGVEALVETGVRLDAEVTTELLETIFWPGSALHDLGVIIRHSRIAAAGCPFPLAEPGTELDRSLGSRHMAAIGLSQECDALVLVVSEETGAISVAQRGNLRRSLTPNALREALVSSLVSRPADSAQEPDPIEPPAPAKPAATRGPAAATSQSEL